MVRVPSVNAVGVMFHVPSDCTSAVSVCEPTVTRTTVPGATSLVPAIVGVGLFVITDAPPSIVTTGDTVSIVSCWVALPVVPCPVDHRGDDRVGAVRQVVEVTDHAPSDGVAVRVCPAIVTVTTAGCRDDRSCR